MPYRHITIYVFALILAVCVLTLPALAWAQDIPSLGTNLENLGNAARYDTTQNSISDYPLIVGMIVKYFLYLVGVIYLGLMIYAGSIWMMAHGNEEAVVKSKTITRNAT